jgi:hypothetical protein
MNRLLAFLLVVTTPLWAEEVTLKQPALLKVDRNVASLKAGTVVELISRDGKEITIKYKNLTGKIPASTLEEPRQASAPPKQTSAPPAKPREQTKAAKKPPEKKPANPPQTIYGKAVQKAKDNAAAHEKNLVRPADEVLKD